MLLVMRLIDVVRQGMVRIHGATISLLSSKLDECSWNWGALWEITLRHSASVKKGGKALSRVPGAPLDHPDLLIKPFYWYWGCSGPSGFQNYGHRFGGQPHGH